MSAIVYSGKIDSAAAFKMSAPFKITMHAMSSDDYRPSILVQLDFGNALMSFHLNPEDAASFSEHLKLAVNAALASEVMV